MIITAQVAVTTTAADFNADAGWGEGGPTTITVLNTGATTLYIGGPNVTTSNGFPVAAGAALSIDNVTVNDLYAVAASSGSLAFLYERNG